MIRRIVLAVVMVALLSVAAVPALSEAPPVPEAWTLDWCNNGIGWSIPGPGGGDPHCVQVDCCNWYQTDHVHDLGLEKFVNWILVLYTPGNFDGCQDTLTISVSTDGQQFYSLRTFPTTSVWLGGTWQKYRKFIWDPMSVRYVKLSIPYCYNDFSWALAP